MIWLDEMEDLSVENNYLLLHNEIYSSIKTGPTGVICT